MSGNTPWTIDGFLEARNGRLHMDGADVASIAAERGTPLYLFSESRIRANIAALRQSAARAWPRVKLCYATKANSNMAVLCAARESGIDIEVNSGGELFKALRAGFHGSQIIFNGVSKTAKEIEEALAADIYAINLDSIYELELVASIARRMGRRANVAFRLVPEIETRSHIALQTALYNSKFGISPSQFLEGFTLALKMPELINPRGIHIHVGSQTPDVAPYARAFKSVIEHLIDLHRATGHKLDHINLGGGMPVDYLRDGLNGDGLRERERVMLSGQLDIADILQASLDEAYSNASDRAEAAELLEDITIVFEPGRSIVADAGIVLTAICNVKTRPETGDTWLLTDAGFNLMLSMATYKWYYHAVAAARASEPHDTPYKLAGPLCDSGDVYFDLESEGRLPDYRLLPANMQPGDVLALLNAGAYTLSQEMASYNDRPRPCALMIKSSGSVEVIRRQGNYDDLIANDVW